MDKRCKNCHHFENDECLAGEDVDNCDQYIEYVDELDRYEDDDN